MSNNLESIKSDIETLPEKARVAQTALDKTDNRAMSLIYRTQGDLHQAKANIIELIEQQRKDALDADEIPFPD